MVEGGNSFGRNEFVNCPFDAAYDPLLRPLLFTILQFGVSGFLDFAQEWASLNLLSARAAES